MISPEVDMDYKVKDVIKVMEDFAPLSLQEKWS